ncbi:TetR/AcrR family transcriptional regulator [Tabrizicola sp.]|uniref:TetR/AcrR family transcriptional regulator n=1 Tax=Tabrizicola sp. TaxID=2005166 RepID=UPI003F418699
MTTNLRGTTTRQQILEVARAAVLAKGFDATSIDEIVAAVDITKGGFFYHFPDKTALARALIDDYVATENVMLDNVFARAAELNDDPLHRVLIGLKLLAEIMADLPKGHPGCIVATACYQDRLFDAEVRDLIRDAMLGWRGRFEALFAAIADRYPAQDAVSASDLADMLMSIVDGAIILSRAVREPKALSKQVLMFRSYVKVLYTPQRAFA